MISAGHLYLLTILLLSSVDIHPVNVSLDVFVFSVKPERTRNESNTAKTHNLLPNEHHGKWIYMYKHLIAKDRLLALTHTMYRMFKT